MFKPKKLLPNKTHKNLNKKSKKENISYLHNYGILSTSFAIITAKQLEALRRYVYRRLKTKTKKRSKVHINYPLFKKASKARMGKGKGKFVK